MKITLSQNQIDKLTNNQLRELAKSGTLGVMLNNLENTMNLPNRDDYKHLTGVLHLSAAARKYGLPKVTILGWIKSGMLNYVGVVKNRKLINESDIAYLSARYKSLGGSQGKRIMN